MTLRTVGPVVSKPQQQQGLLLKRNAANRVEEGGAAQGTRGSVPLGMFLDPQE